MSPVTSGPLSRKRGSEAVRLLLATAAALGLAGFAHIYTDPEPLAIRATEIALVTVPVVVLVYGGYWALTHRLDERDRWSIATWCLVGVFVTGGLVAISLYSEGAIANVTTDAFLLFVLAMLGGGVVGVLAAMEQTRPTEPLSLSIQTSAHTDADTALRPPSPRAQTFADAMSRPYSWYTVQLLAAADGPVAVETIVSQIAAFEGTSNERITLELVRTHLPRLADDGVIEYDSTRGVVRADENLASFVAAGNALCDRSDDP